MAHAQVNVEFVQNERGGESLVHNGFRFQVKNRRGDRVYWKCHIRDCRATINTFQGILTKVGNQHNHEADPVQLEVDRVMHKVKKRCREELTPIPSLFQEEIAKLRTPEWNDDMKTMVEKLPTYDSCRTSLYNQRSKLLPKLPRTRQDINLDAEWTQTTTGERFLIVNDGDDNKMLVFSTQRNLEHLVAADIVYGDGTFYTCPDIFSQLYTLHAMLDNVMYPLVYALLPGKSRDMYMRLFRHLRDVADQHQLQFNPRTLLVDYEAAVKRAAEEVFDDVSVKGCFFHYTQCIWRKAQHLGLPIPYRQNEHIK